MRNKIKQLLKKEGGFTLVELLAVLAILAIIVGISIPMVGKVISNSQTKADDSQIELILDAARLYQVENEVENEDGILVKTLVPDYLEEEILTTTLRGVTIGDTTTVGELKEATAD